MENRELDRKIAEKLGWTEIVDGNDHCYGYPPEPFKVTGTKFPLPNWSSYLDRAIILWPMKDKWFLGKEYSVDQYWYIESRGNVIANAPTPALAICLAFLKEGG